MPLRPTRMGDKKNPCRNAIVVGAKTNRTEGVCCMWDCGLVSGLSPGRFTPPAKSLIHGISLLTADGGAGFQIAKSHVHALQHIFIPVSKMLGGLRVYLMRKTGTGRGLVGVLWKALRRNKSLWDDILKVFRRLWSVVLPQSFISIPDYIFDRLYCHFRRVMNYIELSFHFYMLN